MVENSVIYGFDAGPSDYKIIPIRGSRNNLLNPAELAQQLLLFFGEVKEQGLNVALDPEGLLPYPEEVIAPLFRFAPKGIDLPEAWNHPSRYKQYRILIAGSRSAQCDTRTFLRLDKVLAKILGDLDDVCILNGTAKGGDAVGKAWGNRLGIEVVDYPAAWKVLNVPGAVIKRGRYGDYNARAGHDRNACMGVAATHGVLIWDGASPGTKNMHSFLEENAIPARILKF